MPYHRKLTPAASSRFKERLRSIRQTHALSLVQVARILQCSRKTAWVLLTQTADTRQVRSLYAHRLADHYKQTASALCVDPPRSRVGVVSMLDDWAVARTPARRRSVAGRLARFVQELAVISHGLTVVVRSYTGIDGDPSRAVFELATPGRRDASSITLHLDAARRDSVEMIFTNPQGHNVYHGHLNQLHLGRLLKKSQACQPAG